MNLIEKYGVEPNPQSCDALHVEWMLGVLMAWPFRKCLEIGTCIGASTTAFVEATNRGHAATFHTVDLNWQAAADAVIEQASQPIVAHRNVTSLEVLRHYSYSADVPHSTPFDWVFVDGDRSLMNVQQELDAMLTEGNAPLAIFAHDTSNRDGGDYSGAVYLKQLLQTTPPYMCLEDALYRDGQRTERGMFFACRDAHLFEIARRILRRIW